MARCGYGRSGDPALLEQFGEARLLRVRPKVMTVAVDHRGVLPILWRRRCRILR